MSPHRVLIVDDDPGIRESLREVLEDEGFATALAADGSEALAWLDLHHQQTCLVLLDLMMPVMNGQDFLVKKEGKSALAGVPVVVITASGREACDQLLARHRVRECLHKPISLPRLLSVVRSSVPQKA